MSEKAKAGRFIAVMGDLVSSESVTSRAQLHQNFNNAVSAVNAQFSVSLPSPLTITLGDEFQGLTFTAAEAFRIVLAIRLRLLRVHVLCRFVIGPVDLATPVNPDRAWNMMGDGLAQARERLNDKKDGNAYRFSFYQDKPLSGLLEAVGSTLTMIEEGWTPTQASYVLSHILDGAEVPEIAGKNAVSERAVYKVLSAARLSFYQDQIEALLTFLASRDELRSGEE
ncbi:SatD family protein [Roseibium litorale]|uniref:SatD family (SatD) n=1 Tax=Roseibium litorale TaxID=2803841 RepID=A0ABR9CLP1_9HYPH|nr:SatD family protein [Roseibium litorale]MBD8891772.1 hypothetical protein [Roseibium litorale]